MGYVSNLTHNGKWLSEGAQKRGVKMISFLGK